MFAPDLSRREWSPGRTAGAAGTHRAVGRTPLYRKAHWGARSRGRPIGGARWTRDAGRPGVRTGFGLRRCRGLPIILSARPAPVTTLDWVSERRQTNLPTVWRIHPDINHPGVVGSGGAEALSWTIDQLDGSTTPRRRPKPPRHHQHQPTQETPGQARGSWSGRRDSNPCRVPSSARCRRQSTLHRRVLRRGGTSDGSSTQWSGPCRS